MKNQHTAENSCFRFCYFSGKMKANTYPNKEHFIKFACEVVNKRCMGSYSQVGPPAPGLLFSRLYPKTPAATNEAKA